MPHAPRMHPIRPSLVRIATELVEPRADIGVDELTPMYSVLANWQDSITIHSIGHMARQRLDWHPESRPCSARRAPQA